MASLAAEVDAEPDELVRAFDELGRLDARHLEVDARELLGADLGGSDRRGGGFSRGHGHLHELLHAGCVHAGRERRVFVDLAAEQRFLDVAPVRDPRAKEGLRALRDLRQDGLQVGHQHAEQVDALRADGLDLRGAGRVLGGEPGFPAVDVEVGLVRERHDLPDGRGVLERLPGLHDASAGVRELAVERRIRQRGGELPAVPAVDEARAAARDVDELADELGVDTRRELLEVHVDVLEPRPELGREEVAEVLRRQVLEVALRGHEGAA